MNPHDITPREALTRLGASTAEAIARVLETFAPDAVERGEVSVVPEGRSPFERLTPGSLATSVSYVDGVTGANIFVLTPAGARVLSCAMGLPAPDPDGTGEAQPPLSELELSAIGEAANQMMAAAAAAIGVVLGQEIEISPPDTRILADPEEALEVYGRAPHATSTTFLIGGESCRLIQLVPSAFVMRMARAIDELNAEHDRPPGDGRADHAAGRSEPAGEGLGVEEVLSGINLRVWAELGRTRMPLRSALTLPIGAVIDLDRSAEAPVDVFINGLRFAHGRLLVTDDGEWAVGVDDLVARRAAPVTAPASNQRQRKGV